MFTWCELTSLVSVLKWDKLNSICCFLHLSILSVDWGWCHSLVSSLIFTPPFFLFFRPRLPKTCCILLHRVSKSCLLYGQWNWNYCASLFLFSAYGFHLSAPCDSSDTHGPLPLPPLLTVSDFKIRHKFFLCVCNTAWFFCIFSIWMTRSRNVYWLSQLTWELKQKADTIKGSTNSENRNNMYGSSNLYDPFGVFWLL